MGKIAEKFIIQKGLENVKIRVSLRDKILHVEKWIDDIARAQFRTCAPPSYSNFWSNLSQHFFLQKMIRNDVLSDRKVLQRFIDIGKGLFTSFLV